MNSGVKIIKRDRAPESSRLSQHEKTARQSEREIAGTVKNWIVQLAQRRHTDELNAHWWIRSIPPTEGGGSFQILSTKPSQSPI